MRPNTKSCDSSQDTLLYVFNFAGNSGFSIISASNDVQPILAVIEAGNYVAGEPTGNGAFDLYMDNLIEELSTRAPAPELYSWYEYVQDGETVSPKVSVNWGQTNIYGQYCPNYISGCGATAVAQIMTYYRHPDSFVATCAMGSDYSIGDTIQLDWNLINTHVSSHTDSKTCTSVHNNIGALLREIGHQVNMSYGTNSSSAYLSDIHDAFEYFGYTTTADNSPSISTIKNAVKTNGPVFMYGRDSVADVGHFWVIDGYKDYEYYRYRYERAMGNGSEPIVTQITLMEEAHSLHINWGWNGNYNGYFAFGIYDVSEADSYDGSHGVSDADYGSNNKIIMVNID